MGCDIHLHVEVKHETKGWLHYSHPKIDRWYDLFARMADVRNDDREIDPISKPRGLPDDASEMTRLCYEWDDGDAHSASWLERDEIKLLNEFIQQHPMNSERRWHDFDARCGYLFGSSLECDPSGRGTSRPAWIVDCRVVFWFDC